MPEQRAPSPLPPPPQREPSLEVIPAEEEKPPSPVNTWREDPIYVLVETTEAGPDGKINRVNLELYFILGQSKLIFGLMELLTNFFANQNF